MGVCAHRNSLSHRERLAGRLELLHVKRQGHQRPGAGEQHRADVAPGGRFNNSGCSKHREGFADSPARPSNPATPPPQQDPHRVRAYQDNDAHPEEERDRARSCPSVPEDSTTFRQHQRLVAPGPGRQSRCSPLRFQVPPTAPSASQSVCTGPPERSTFFSLASAKKAISRLSGDQKGSTALSVPARGVISRLSRARTQICCFPSFRRTTAMARPSGETARDMMRALSGSRMFMRATGSSAGFPRNHRNPSAADKSSATVGRPIHLCRCCPGLQCNRWIDLDRLLRTLSETPDSPGSPVKRFQWINPMCAG